MISFIQSCNIDTTGYFSILIIKVLKKVLKTIFKKSIYRNFIMHIQSLMVLVFSFNKCCPFSAPASTSLLCCALLSLQCFARLYECRWVSVFSPRGRMGVAHYLVGVLHYACAFCTIMACAEPFGRKGGTYLALPFLLGSLVDYTIKDYTVSQDVQTRFSVQLAFAKFLFKIKGNF